MNQRIVAIVVRGGLALIVLLGAPFQSHAQSATVSYPRMAALDQYLMGRGAGIALARTAAPESISRDATVLVLGRHGYESAVEGKNGFVCLVERSWGAPFDWPEFWNPKVRSANCVNPLAAQTIIPILREEAELLMAGRPRTETINAVKASFAKGELPALKLGAMNHLMGKRSFLTDAGSHNLSHVMFYTVSDAAAWGANMPDSPLAGGSIWFSSQRSNHHLKGLPEINIFIVAVRKWSDGTPVVPTH